MYVTGATGPPLFKELMCIQTIIIQKPLSSTVQRRKRPPRSLNAFLWVSAQSVGQLKHGSQLEAIKVVCLRLAVGVAILISSQRHKKSRNTPHRLASNTSDS